MPDPATLPSIVAVSSHNITPRGNLTITGENFGDTQGNVFFRIEGRDIRGTIHQWTHTCVRVSMPYIEGVAPSSNCVLDLVTSTGSNSTHMIDFSPVVTFASWPRQIISYEDHSQRQTIQAFGGELKNGYTVMDVQLRNLTINHADKIRFLTRPDRGDTEINCTVEVDPLPNWSSSSLNFQVVLFMIGPVGCSYR